MATEKRKVILLSEIKYGVKTDGKMKFFVFSPGKRSEPVKHTLLPINIYEALKDSQPPLFKDVVETVVEDIIEGVGEVVELQNTTPRDNRDADAPAPLKPLADIDIVDAEELSSDESVESVDAEAVAVKELKKINGVGAGIAKNLYDSGYKTVEDVAFATDLDALIALDGIGEHNVDAIIDSAKGLVD